MYKRGILISVVGELSLWYLFSSRGYSDIIFLCFAVSNMDYALSAPGLQLSWLSCASQHERWARALFRETGSKIQNNFVELGCYGYKHDVPMWLNFSRGWLLFTNCTFSRKKKIFETVDVFKTSDIYDWILMFMRSWIFMHMNRSSRLVPEGRRYQMCCSWRGRDLKIHFKSYIWWHSELIHGNWIRVFERRINVLVRFPNVVVFASTSSGETTYCSDQIVVHKRMVSLAKHLLYYEEKGAGIPKFVPAFFSSYKLMSTCLICFRSASIDNVLMVCNRLGDGSHVMNKSH